jgi:hypothetical protein
VPRRGDFYPNESSLGLIHLAGNLYVRAFLFEICKNFQGFLSKIFFTAFPLPKNFTFAAISQGEYGVVGLPRSYLSLPQVAWQNCSFLFVSHR